MSIFHITLKTDLNQAIRNVSLLHFQSTQYNEQSNIVIRLRQSGDPRPRLTTSSAQDEQRRWRPHDTNVKQGSSRADDTGVFFRCFNSSCQYFLLIVAVVSGFVWVTHRLFIQNLVVRSHAVADSLQNLRSRICSSFVFGLSFSSPAFFTPVFLVLHFPVLHFPPPLYLWSFIFHSWIFSLPSVSSVWISLTSDST